MEVLHSHQNLSKAGMHIYARASAKGKRVQSNMGAKNNAIVMPDANEDATFNALVASGFGAAGQRCMALSTAVFVGGLKSCENKLVERAKALKVNAGTEPNADLGPVISKQGMSEDVSINKFFDEAMMVELAQQSADLHHAMM
ncbi:methylmalonate-semialdehyde dehydrogenase [acylating], mitochondrial-like isoform X1 [Castanea sativa]|uniref:methylmalonate-semialdehyde dehydrogenase [acylating], mitochondrial-like isoform X1 n=1 Tax=Castanea sativa TaxID=21020 RepID=UPI003F64EE36